MAESQKALDNFHLRMVVFTAVILYPERIYNSCHICSPIPLFRFDGYARQAFQGIFSRKDLKKRFYLCIAFGATIRVISPLLLKLTRL